MKQRLGSASPVKLRTAEDDSGGSRQVLIAAGKQNQVFILGVWCSNQLVPFLFYDFF